MVYLSCLLHSQHSKWVAFPTYWRWNRDQGPGLRQFQKGFPWYKYLPHASFGTILLPERNHIGSDSARGKKLSFSLPFEWVGNLSASKAEPYLGGKVGRNRWLVYPCLAGMGPIPHFLSFQAVGDHIVQEFLMWTSFKLCTELQNDSSDVLSVNVLSCFW